MDVKKNIRSLRIISLLLFFEPAFGLIGSLAIHNYFVSFNFTYAFDYKFEERKPGNSSKILCNQENNFCENISVKGFSKFNKLNKCYKNKVVDELINEKGKKVNLSPEEIKNFKENIYYKVIILDVLEENCILNSKFAAIYNFFPYIFETTYKIKQNTTIGTSEKINPIINGETSISNIVKRFPVSYFFKPILYLSVILMIIYWSFYNKIFRNILVSKNNYYFYNLGILSAIFLFLHVFFLGYNFESEILTKIRRSLVVFFILFEILAQSFLLKKIFLIKKNIKDYTNIVIIYSKLTFVFLVCISTVVILTILIFYNLDSKIDYILEWNYFLLLLFFYFLSFLMWKKSY